MGAFDLIYWKKFLCVLKLAVEVERMCDYVLWNIEVIVSLNSILKLCEVLVLSFILWVFSADLLSIYPSNT